MDKRPLLSVFFVIITAQDIIEGDGGSLTRGFPKPVSPCKDKKCEEGQVCKLHQVTCVTTPCPPLAVCCDPVLCECKFGFKKKEGCEICECNPSPCETITCPKGQVCKVLGCRLPPYVCQPITVCRECGEDCGKMGVDCGKMGQKLDGNGCPTCECNPNPCDKEKCLNGQLCRLQDVQCPAAPCLPIAVCYNDPAKIPCKNPAKGKDGKRIFCGRGPTRQDCPPGYECKISPTDRWAVCCPKGCSYNGKLYEHKETFKADCKTCKCKKGEVKCKKAKGKTCTDKEGNIHCSGDKWETADGCNTCRCRKGKIRCSKRKCPGGGCPPPDNTKVCVRHVPLDECKRTCTGRVKKCCLVNSGCGYQCIRSIDCRLVDCAEPECPFGKPFTPDGSCCPICPDDCRLVKCDQNPKCSIGEHFTPEGSCCPICPYTP